MGYKGKGEIIFVEAICSKVLGPSPELSEGNVEKILTSNRGCRREEKSHKHWSLFTKLLSSVTAIVFIC